jgi:hypothetical protein
MQLLSEKLLSAALHVLWEQGHSADRRAVELIAQRVRGFSAEQYGEASELAAAMDAAAYDLAAAWFASKGKGEGPTVEVLQAATRASLGPTTRKR